MKKIYLNIAVLISSLLFITSCEKDKIGGTATENMAGEWYVQYDHSYYGEDPFGAGLTAILTYNTSADDNNFIWLTDNENFWPYKVKIPCNLTDMSFGGEDTIINAVTDYPIKVLIRNGKIIKNGSTRPSGRTDSIHFEVWFEDLEDATGFANDTLHVSGFRRTGLAEDEP